MIATKRLEAIYKYVLYRKEAKGTREHEHI